MHKDFIRTTEASSLYNHIEQSSTGEILKNINTEDKKVALEVEKQIPQIELLVDAAFEKLNNGGRLFYIEKSSTKDILTNINTEDKKVALEVEKQIPQIELLIDAAFEKLNNGGRLFYIGAGTSGRLGLVDASECPPTFGVSEDLVVGIIAGGQKAMFHAVENAEDDIEQAWIDLQAHTISPLDVVIGIAASGTTPYVIGGLHKSKEAGILTGSISCNKNSPVSAIADFPIEVEVGPEFLTGSTRMKSGTAQKMVLNMISTSIMIKLGRIKGNKMVNMQLTNQKLFDRGVKMIMEELNLTDMTIASSLLKEHGSVKKSIDNYKP